MEKSPSIVPQIKWKLTNVKGSDAFSSNKIKYKKNEYCFRVLGVQELVVLTDVLTYAYFCHKKFEQNWTEGSSC